MTNLEMVGNMTFRKSRHKYKTDENVNEWVSVEERTPFGIALVSIYEEGVKYFDIAYWHEDRDCWVNNINQRIDGVTHWMSLPEPPK